MNRKIAVLKFGGTSVADESSRSAAFNWIKSYTNSGFKVVVVVSAMGRSGAPYATDTLLNLLRKENDNEMLTDFLVSCGELISAAVMADMLLSSGIPAIPLSGGQAGIITDMNYNDAEILKIKSRRILNELSIGNVAVIAGFQGVNQEGRVTTLGRGGSDITALKIGNALKAEEIVIFSDIKGVAVTDPGIVSDAGVYDELSAEQLHLMACCGAGVIHEKAVKTSLDAGIDFYIRSTFLNETGTLVCTEKGKGIKDFAGIAIKSKNNMEDDISIIFQNSHILKVEQFINNRDRHIQAADCKMTDNSGNSVVTFRVKKQETEGMVNEIHDYFWKNHENVKTTEDRVNVAKI